MENLQISETRKIPACGAMLWRWRLKQGDTARASKTVDQRVAALDPIQLDVWLTKQIGKPAYRLHGPPGDGLPPAPSFCYAKISSDDRKFENCVKVLGFIQVETLRTYQKLPSLNAAPDPRIRLARPEDRPRVEQIARGSFRFSRFHADARFGQETGNRIKVAWVGNFFEGRRGDCLFVIVDKGSTAGFILLLETPHATVVDLIAVDPAFQGRGLGRALLGQAEKRGQRLIAGTQEANLPSCLLYESSGFFVEKTEGVFHLHR